jgi:transcriptional antiterminator RfaH
VIWFAAYTAPRAESLAEAGIRDLGYLAYCPRETVLVRHANRQQTKLRPLFPRYLFLAVNEMGDFGRMRDVRGLERIVKSGGALPCYIKNDYIHDLQQLEMMGAFDRRPKPDPEFIPGERVRLPNGLEGVVLEMRPDKRVALLLTFLGATREQVFPARKLERVG